MAKAIALYKGGITDLREVAIRADGAVFNRFQVKDPRYGYRWTAWKATNETIGANMLNNPPARWECGFANLHLCRPNDPCVNHAAMFNAKDELRVRLPN